MLHGLIVVALMVGLVGCVPNIEYARPDATSTLVFSKAGATADDYNRDMDECRARAVEIWKDRVAVYGKRNQERQSTNTCMTMRGWDAKRNHRDRG